MHIAESAPEFVYTVLMTDSQQHINSLNCVQYDDSVFRPSTTGLYLQLFRIVPLKAIQVRHKLMLLHESGTWMNQWISRLKFDMSCVYIEQKDITVLGRKFSLTQAAPLERDHGILIAFAARFDEAV